MSPRWREVGFNRASIGVQDFNPKVQTAMHRIQPREQTEQAMQWARAAGFQSVNLDLIYGLPFQTVETFAANAERNHPTRPRPAGGFQLCPCALDEAGAKNSERAALPSAETKLNILKLVIEKLTQNDQYTYIGMDHFARPNDELAVAQRQKTLQRNFQGYSTKGGADIYAFGMSAISQADGVYWQNIKDLAEYYKVLDSGWEPFAKGYVLSSDDKIRRQTIMRLMCDMSLDYASLSKGPRGGLYPLFCRRTGVHDRPGKRRPVCNGTPADWW